MFRLTSKYPVFDYLRAGPKNRRRLTQAEVYMIAFHARGRTQLFPRPYCARYIRRQFYGIETWVVNMTEIFFGVYEAI